VLFRSCHHNCFHLYIAYSFAPPYLVLLNAVEKRHFYKYSLLEHLVSERVTNELFSCSLHKNRPLHFHSKSKFIFLIYNSNMFPNTRIISYLSMQDTELGFERVTLITLTVLHCSFINYFVNKYGSHAQQRHNLKWLRKYYPPKKHEEMPTLQENFP